MTYQSTTRQFACDPAAVGGASDPIRAILEKALSGGEVSTEEGVALFRAEGTDIDAVYRTADTLRRRANGDRVSFVVNRNINFTNICYMGCKFCGFAKRTEDKSAEWLEPAQIVERAQQAWDRGATEVCIQGGLHPKMEGTYYREIIRAIKTALPGMHIHAFSPFEIWYGASKTKMSYRDFLTDLKEAGLDSMPGTAAEILDTEVRMQLTTNKLSAERWVEIIRTAHEVGIPTTATIMYGHVDAPEHWAAHIALLRDIQKDTGGFTELVPLSFVHTDSPLYAQNPDKVRPGPTAQEVDLMHAVSRIMLHGWIDNIQVSWTKLGAARAQQMLSRGVNDLGGTLMNESISRAAGSDHGQEITARELVRMIRAAGRVPVRRNTVYETREVFENHDPEELAPLVDRKGRDPLAFLEMFPERPAAIEAAR
ncbi:5-amino-6-(D-ribitylamino)uracil--L-tyrosine 4-hydroxyphenyl transferase CofH [Limimaricola sp. G21655-S1]|uniref:5-amino-6-(D-ribitylamino)uracil--L-tyrosine 4-hydroxyphenyl transferase CofH n=1 Tax=Limimaricola sp. G21655-S1 TaxID=3014768 RepID=UPI0022B03ED1|nr:5-amino-6-(D-ribitylamino)uracil--L-tyrosine 4-hydroxyphenyl transferase CofH [Limimaricola sp. G21655-S1]MCZ4262374.1 5-amino-6-(D-ribitylamino)uracil--L-tyrosine 4-hydroxyphenyl transferase CofH [Limimaricola sp. G21655-S1]